MRGNGNTKSQMILDPYSVWNQAGNNEPLVILRSNDWREVMAIALIKEDIKDPAFKILFEAALKLKEYHDENDIPF